MLASLARQDDRLELKRGSPFSSTQCSCAERASMFLRRERSVEGGGGSSAGYPAANE